jgi:DNA-binding NtrC family response regulator
MPDRILLVEDEPILRVTLANDLADAGFEVASARDGAEGQALIEQQHFDVALLDLKLPKVDGLTLLELFLTANRQGVAVMMTAYGTVESAVAAMKRGAADFLLKPFPSEDVVAVLRGLLARRASNVTGEEVPGTLRRCGDLVYVSESMARVADMIGAVAGSDATVLIQGETGTGKELVARAIHERSARSQQPLVSVACAALPETLLEAELFGHERGAFTGAIRERKGRFELAHRGTLFLDEIADLGAAVQAKLIRVLQERAFQRVGGTRTLNVDVRIVSATRRRLEDEVIAGRMREDLFYRLKVITLVLPALRERRDDILPLTEYFIAKYARALGKDVHDATPEARQRLLAHDWPGNVRELEACIERAVVLTKHVELDAADLDCTGLDLAPAATGHGGAHALADTVREAERRHLVEVLRSVDGERQRAAGILGISRKTLWKKMKVLGVE